MPSSCDGTTDWDTSPLHAFAYLLSLELFLKSYLLSRPQNVLDACTEQWHDDHGEQEELKTKTNFE
jgi:hypothetical protein